MKIKNASNGLGAYIEGIDLSKELKESDLLSIARVMMEKQVVFFVGQKLSHKNQVDFARQFGELKTYKASEYGQTPEPEIICVSNVVPGGHLGNKDLIWHTDSSFAETPATFTFLYASEVPSSGGDTYWADMYAAFEALSPDFRKRVEDIKIQHDNTYNVAGEQRVLLKSSKITGEKIKPGAVHPLVMRHPITGREALYYGRVGLNQIVGCDAGMSQTLLEEIEQKGIQPQFVHCHKWSKGDFAIWDNRCTMHRRDEFNHKAQRIMYRCEAFTYSDLFLKEKRKAA